MKFFDNTRISDFRTCPRYFYYRHVRYWTTPVVSSALAFGSGWHAAMDSIWQGGTTEEAAEAWSNLMIENGIDIYSPEYGLSDFRTEGTLREMLNNYVETRRDFLGSIQVLQVEHPFAVPIEEAVKVFYVGRLDKVFKRKARTYIIDHKTTSLYAKAGGFRPLWLNSFSPNSQIDGYSYAGHLLYPDDFKAVWIDGALVYKTVHDAFIFLPLERSSSMLELWLEETTYWIAQIMENLKHLEEVQQEVPATVLDCFPRNAPNSCSQYGRECLYKEICSSIPNPETIETPSDFTERKWEPFAEDELKKLGFDKEES